MQSRSSMASSESRIVNIQGSEPTLASPEEKALARALPPTITTATEEDPFVVKLDRSDPSHPQVCIAHHFFRCLAGID